jgi:nucleoid DNA-binding protein
MEPKVRIDSFISDLLYTNDCVIIPGLGGFVANSRGAFLNPAQHTFSPPLKRIAFNASLRINDGLLTHYISRTQDITYFDAINIVQRFVDDCFLKLNAGEKITIENVGVLSFDLEQHLQFEPSTNLNYLLESFGLTTIHSPAIRRDEKQAPIRKLKKQKQQKGEAAKRWRLLELVPAAAVLALLVFNPRIIQTLNTSLGSIIPLQQTSGSFNKKSKINNPAAKYEYFQTEAQPVVVDSAKLEEAAILNQQQIDATAKSMQEAFDRSVDEATDAILAEEGFASNTAETVSAPAVHTATAKPDEAVVASKVETATPSYNVIGGCFSVEENANKYAAEANAIGLTASVIGKNDKGLWMVSLYSGTSLQQAQEELKAIKSKFQSGAWLYKK